MLFVALLGSAFYTSTSFAQSSLLKDYGIYDSIPVIYQGDSIISPWSGGLHSPILSSADMNKDGRKDLVSFDRKDNSINVFLNEIRKGRQVFRHAPKLTQYFPNVDSWVLFYDYNNDSLPDLFTTNVGAIQVHKNISKDPTQKLEWKLLYFKSPADSTKWEAGISHKLYYSPKDYAWSSVSCNNLDIPALNDIDGDGDMDIVVLTGTSGQAIHYKNVSVDSTGSADTLDYRLERYCYGSFSEDLTNNSIVLKSCNFLAPSEKNTRKNNGASRSDNASRHLGGSSIYITTLDSGVYKDCFISGALAPYVRALYNDTSNIRVEFSEIDSLWNTKDKEVALNFFVRPLATDVDGDSVGDLVFTPANYLTNRDHKHFWYYKNVGSDVNPDFRFQDSTTFYDQTIDVGTDARPLYFDVNGDSLMDLLVGHSHYSDGNNFWTQVAYYRNVGDDYTPRFEFVTRDLDIIPNNLNGSHLAKWDLDNDGSMDLVVTQNDGSAKWYKNVALPGDSAQFVATASTLDSINFGTNAKLFFHDWNSDGLEDVFVGWQSPFISYYENKGSPGNPIFPKRPTRPQFGWITVKDNDPNNDPLLSPLFLRVDTAGKLSKDSTDQLYFVIGVSEGPIYTYTFDSNGTAIPLDTTFMYNSNLSLAAEVLNRDSIPVIAAGTQRGGLINLVRGRGFVPAPPPCLASSAIIINPSSADSAIVRWAPGSGRTWSIGWALSGASIPSDSVTGLTTPTYTIKGLVQETEYDVWVKDYCSNDTTDWVGPSSFMLEPNSVSERGLASRVSAYPNPFTDHITIITKNESLSHMMLINAEGRIVRDASQTGKSGTLNTSGIAPGIYTVSISMNTGERVFKKLVKLP